MNKTTLIIIIVFLVFLLAFLLFLLFKVKKKRKKDERCVIKKEKNFFDILKVLKDKSSSEKKLKESIDFLIKRYCIIDNFDNYEKAIIYLCIHPNTNKKLIIQLDLALEKNNPKYMKEIARALKIGLDSH